MRRPIKIAIWSVGAITATGVALVVLLIWRFVGSAGSTVESRELSAEELSGSLQHLNPSIRVIAGFSASEYGGWHGDGGSVDIYLVEPSGTAELIAGIKRYHEERRKAWPGRYSYKWSESSRPDLSLLDELIPKKFQPRPGVYLIARERNGTHTISIERQTGYVCFAHSRT